MVSSPSPYTVAVIGAASGIGRASAMLMASRGNTVICLDRDGKGAEATAKEIRDAGGLASSHAIERTDAPTQAGRRNDIIASRGQPPAP